MIAWVLTLAGMVYALAVLRAYLTRDLAGCGYPSPAAAEAEIDELCRAHPERARLEEIGKTSLGRPVRSLVLRGARAANSETQRPRLLVTAQIHAVEFVGSFVARALARQLASDYGRKREVTALLDQADVYVVPLLNPDGADRVWQRGGYVGFAGGRFTAKGVDPNRNFPYLSLEGASAWNSGRGRPGSAYYRGEAPLSEPECLALAKLCKRERFCAAIHFHSFGGIVYFPTLERDPGGIEIERARHALSVFQGEFQSNQPHLRYRPVPEAVSTIVGQLDAFLLGAFGTPSATIEVSRPGLHLLKPSHFANAFWISNPERPERWVENDVAAAIRALAALLERTGGRPCPPLQPELADRVPD
ncbi:MAG: M14 family zinc carboxypeptidase [Myxococcota bacterium]